MDGRSGKTDQDREAIVNRVAWLGRCVGHLFWSFFDISRSD